jgi:hypothetical protein
MPATNTAKRRVIALCKAISDLHHGDLLKVLKLNEYTPLKDFAANDVFRLAPDGKSLIHIPVGPRPRSLKHRARTGEQLARILENHLVQVMVFGETELPTVQRKPRRNELGGRVFSQKISSETTR